MATKTVWIDRSDKADAERFRWLLNGNGYFMEENYLCGSLSESGEGNQDKARARIDEQIRLGLDYRNRPTRQAGG